MIRNNKLNRKKNIDDSVNLIPMINLVFLLLIFFLLTGVIQKKEDPTILVPESKQGMRKNNVTISQTIQIDENGIIKMEGNLLKFEFKTDKNQLILTKGNLRNRDINVNFDSTIKFNPFFDINSKIVIKEFNDKFFNKINLEKILKNNKKFIQKLDIKNSKLPPGIAIDDGVAVLFVDGSAKEVCSARNGCDAYFIDKNSKISLNEYINKL